jgi:hypothetical protein
MKRSFIMLLLAMAAPAVSAQVYSPNIVGYATVTVAPGYNLLANPLSGGVTNGATEIMPILDGEVILTWFGSRFAQVGYDSGFGGWVAADGSTPANPPALPPGVGFFFFNPNPTATNFTFIGQVVPSPGSTNSISVSKGYNLLGSQLPASVNQITSPPVSLPVIDGMLILQWNGSRYIQTGFDSGFGVWVQADGITPGIAPPYNIGQGFFLFQPVDVNNWRQSLP